MADELVASLPNLYRRSIMIELRKGSRVLESLVLPVPPEGIKIEQGYRKTLTQTFGGVIIDHFGLSLGTISINGHTGAHRERRQTLGGGGAKKIEGPFSSGKAAEEIMKRIIRYPIATETRDEFAKLECWIYDFSSLGNEPDLAGLQDLSSKDLDPVGYVVSLDHFSLSRNANKYGFYQYTLNATILAYFGTYRGRKYDPIISPLPAWLTDLLNWLNKAQAAINQAQAELDAIKNSVQGAMDTATGTGSTITGIISETAELVQTAATMCVDLVAIVSNAAVEIGGQAAGLVSVPAEFMKKTTAAMMASFDSIAAAPAKIKQEFEKTGQKYDNLKGDLESLSSAGFEKMASYYKEETQKSEHASVLSKTATKAKETKVPNTENRAFSAAQSESRPRPEKRVTSYGYRAIPKTPDKPLDKLAQEFLGDYKLGSLILNYNGIKDLDDIEDGNIIRIPVLSKEELIKAQHNEVYAANPNEILGVDIKRDSNGFVVLDGVHGDLKLVSGKDNLAQGLFTRLGTTVGKDARRNTYGIAIEIGKNLGDKVAQSYIMTSIHDTIAQEPRVKELNEINFNIDENETTISVDVSPIVGSNIVVNWRA